MSGRNAKLHRRSVRRLAGKIKSEAWLEFVTYIYAKPFPVRVWVAVRLVFKMIRV